MAKQEWTKRFRETLRHMNAAIGAAVTSPLGALSLYRDLSCLEQLVEAGQIAAIRPFDGSDGRLDLVMAAGELVKEYLDYYKTVGVCHRTRERFGLAPRSLAMHRSMAMIQLPVTGEEYLNRVGSKTRNMIRKAEKRGYESREFDWNEHLHDIHGINVSKSVRSSGPMQGWYVEQVLPQVTVVPGRKCYGVFRDDRLCAYATVMSCGNFAFLKHFIGHAEHMTYGTMNYLMADILQRLNDASGVRWLNYGWAAPMKGTLELVDGFKKHAGFTAYATFWDIPEVPELLVRCRRLFLVKL